MDFIQSFNGFNLEVSRVFYNTFDGTKGKIGNVKLQVTKELIAKEKHISQKCVRWFKNMSVTNIPLQCLLVSRKSQYHIKGMHLDI